MEGFISLKVRKCNRFEGWDKKKNLSRVILWLALGKITQQGTFVFDDSPNSFQWSSILSWSTEASQGPLGSWIYIAPSQHPHTYSFYVTLPRFLSWTEFTTITILFFFWFSIFFVPFTSSAWYYLILKNEFLWIQ